MLAPESHRAQQPSHRDELISHLHDVVQHNLQQYLRERPAQQVLSLDWMQALARTVLTALAIALFDAWKDVLEHWAKQLGLFCPGCGKRRKCKMRTGKPMAIKLLGLTIELPNLRT
jgi:hypothetical protein